MYIGCTKRVGRDVVFVIDTRYYYTSGTGSRFQLVRELIESIIINIKLNSPETLFGLITFDNIARFEFNISEHTNLSTLLPAINPGLPYYSGSRTNTASALRLLLSGSVEGGYLQLRENTSKVAIVIINGYTSDDYSLRSAANSLHAANIFDVYAIGTGINRYSELKLIASDPSLIFSTTSLTSSTAQQIEKFVTDKLCTGNYFLCNYVVCSLITLAIGMLCVCPNSLTKLSIYYM